MPNRIKKKVVSKWIADGPINPSWDSAPGDYTHVFYDPNDHVLLTPHRQIFMEALALAFPDLLTAIRRASTKESAVGELTKAGLSAQWMARAAHKAWSMRDQLPSEGGPLDDEWGFLLLPESHVDTGHHPSVKVSIVSSASPCDRNKRSRERRNREFTISWNPETESAESFKRRAMARMKTVFEELIASTGESYAQRGFVLAKPTRASPKHSSTAHQHFLWLIDYQYKGKSYADVAGADCDEATVREAVRALAAILGISLRKPLRKRAKQRTRISR